MLTNPTERLELVDPESQTESLMMQLAGNTKLPAINIDGGELLDRSKLFLIAEAKNSLSRIIKLTRFLETLEDKFIEAVTESIEQDSSDIQLISASMEIIGKLVDKANEFVMQVLKDDKLQQIIINTTTVITPDGKSATIIDADSRDEIRNVASSLLSQLSAISNDNGD